MNQIVLITMIYWTNNMINWELVIVLTIIAYVMAAIWELAESLVKGDKE